MPRIRVEFRGPLARALGSPSKEVDLQDDQVTLQDLLHDLLGLSDELRRLWATPEEVLQETLVLVNETDATLTGGLTTPLQEGDSVVILPLVHGGAS